VKYFSLQPMVGFPSVECLSYTLLHDQTINVVERVNWHDNENIISGSTKERKALGQLFQELGIDFISYKENIDTTTSMGRLIFHINSAYAEFEREIIKDRVIAGIKAKREKTGTWGRSQLASEVRDKIQDLRANKVSIRNIAKQLAISTRTVRKYKW
jgi:DNA invertase Pin-like site-specific DNA recombinase